MRGTLKKLHRSSIYGIMSKMQSKGFIRVEETTPLGRVRFQITELGKNAFDVWELVALRVLDP